RINPIWEAEIMYHSVRRIACSFLVLIILFALCYCAESEASIIKTDDGLYVRYREFGGGALSLMQWQKPIPLKLIEQDYPSYTLTDYTKPELSGDLAMRSADKGEGWLELASSNKSTMVNAKVRIEEDYARIRYILDVEDLTGEERALRLRYQLPVAAEGWTWWDDPATSRKIEPGKRYIRYDREDPGRYPTCWYPLGTISQPDGDHSLTFAVSMNPPVLSRVGYDGSFFIELDFGVSPETKKFPGKVHLEFVLYTSDPEWGLRSALKKYYDIYPAEFVKRVNREGLWLARAPINTLKNPEDFGVTFHQHSSVKINTLPYDNDAGIYTFMYDMPTAVRMNIPPQETKPTEADFLKFLNDAAADPDHPKHVTALMIKLAGSRRPDGTYYMHMFGGGWRGWKANFQANLDPDLISYPETGQNRLEFWWSHAGPKLMSLREGRHDGVYIDSAEFIVDSIDYNKEHFKHADHPLIGDPNNGRVGVLTAVAMYEYLKETSELMHSNGKLFMANYVPWRHGFFMPVFDVIGTEVWLDTNEWQYLAAKRLKEDGREKLSEFGYSDKALKELKDVDISTPYWKKHDEHAKSKVRAWRREDLMYYRRMLCYQKPYNLLLKVMNEKDAYIFGRDTFREYMDWALFYGIYAAGSEGVLREQDKFVDFYRRCMPVCRAVGTAGWEPITNARTDNPDIRVERFGYAVQGTLHFTLRNFGLEPAKCRLTIDEKALRIPENVEVRNAFTGESMQMVREDGRISVEVELEPTYTTAIKIVKP
ncbi:hypothetical protein ACFL1X_01035, partial [Candidatus Hydrogenedentota bacterium]